MAEMKNMEVEKSPQDNSLKIDSLIAKMAIKTG